MGSLKIIRIELQLTVRPCRIRVLVCHALVNAARNFAGSFERLRPACGMTDHDHRLSPRRHHGEECGSTGRRPLMRSRVRRDQHQRPERPRQRPPPSLPAVKPCLDHAARPTREVVPNRHVRSNPTRGRPRQTVARWGGEPTVTMPGGDRSDLHLEPG
jgi:hypothetical protein